MSLSTLIQKNIPALLFLLGLFFIASALYMSREFEMSYWYVLIGLAFGMYGVGIDFVRVRHRKSHRPPNQQATQSAQ